MPKSHRYAVVLETPSWGDEADHVRRLRAMLKRLGRGYGLRCVEVKPAFEPQPPKPDGEYCYPFSNHTAPELTNSK
jgi:hypothetical protein